MLGKIAWTRCKKKWPNETEEEREARITREMQKVRHAKEVSTVVPSRVSCVEKPFAENSLFPIGLSIVALAFLALGVAGSARTQGQGALNVGVFGLCSLLVSLVAVWYGIRSSRKRGKNHMLTRVETGVGVVLILAWLATILSGIRG